MILVTFFTLYSRWTIQPKYLLTLSGCPLAFTEHLAQRFVIGTHLARRQQPTPSAPNETLGRPSRCSSSVGPSPQSSDEYAEPTSRSGGGCNVEDTDAPPVLHHKPLADQIPSAHAILFLDIGSNVCGTISLRRHVGAGHKYTYGPYAHG